jgi:membrane-associated phospholipid phosphatase
VAESSTVQGVVPLSAQNVPSRPVLAIATLVVLANLALFTLIAEDVLDGGGLISHDEAVLTWLVDHRSERLISAARLVSTAGGFVSLSIIGVATAVVLWRRVVRVALALAPLLSLVLASAASTAAKALFNRDRPPVIVHATTVTLAAFPSGHATDASAFFLAASLTLSLTIAHHRRSQVLLVSAGLFLAALVGVSRLVLGVHWLSDVVAGWALGTAVAVSVVVTAWYASARQSGRCTDDHVPP